LAAQTDIQTDKNRQKIKTKVTDQGQYIKYTIIDN